jgi:uncharacterized protein (DUF342 family)
MENRVNDTIVEIAEKTARIEAHLENHREILTRIEANLVPLTQQVHHHSIIIKGFSWFVGIIVSIFTASLINKL